jgi:hypothetical protein
VELVRKLAIILDDIDKIGARKNAGESGGFGIP